MLSRRKFLGLAGGAAALTFLETCIGPEADFGHYTPSTLETTITDAIGCLTRNEFTSAEHILTRHKDDRVPETNTKYYDDAGYRALLGVAQICNSNNDCQDTFRSLINLFENGPETIVTVRERLRPLFSLPSYREKKQKLLGYAHFLPDLYAVHGFLSLSERRYGHASKAFALVLPRYQHKKTQYKDLFDKLVTHAQKSRDAGAEAGYIELRKLFE